MSQVRAERFPRREGRPRRLRWTRQDAQTIAAQDGGDELLAWMIQFGPSSDIRTYLLDQSYPPPDQDTSGCRAGPAWMGERNPTWTGKGGG